MVKKNKRKFMQAKYHSKLSIADVDSKTEQKLEQTAYIIGDGPGAHLGAIELIQEGMKDVVMIGMRFDEFSRSASFNKKVITDLLDRIAPLKLKISKSRHIKDVERELHERAKELGVLFICGKFDDFENRQLRITNKESSFLLPTHPDDIVIDATGTARSVLKSINARNKENPIFKFTVTENNPHKTYASMRMYYSDELLKVSNRDSSINLDPVSYALAIEELRMIGWQSYAIPYCHHYNQISKPKTPK